METMMTDHADSGDNLTPSLKITGDRAVIEQNLKELMTLCGSNPAEAEKLASDSLASARKLKDHALIGTSLCLLSRAVSLLRGSRESVELAARAVEILRPLDDKKSLATALNNQGNCYRRIAEPLEAIQCYEEALKIQSSIGNRRGIAVVRNNLGLAFRDIASYERAYSSFRQTVDIAEEIDDQLLRTTALSNVADVLIDQGEYQNAEKYLRANLKVNRDLNRRIGEAFCLWELGRMKQKQGHLEDAERLLRESIALRKELGSHKVGHCIFDLAKLLKEDNRPHEAEEVLLEAIDLFKESDNSADLCLARASLSILRIHMGRLEGMKKPLIDFLELLSGLKGDPDRDLRTQALKALSEYNQKKGNLRKALEYNKLYAEEKEELFEQRQRQSITRLKLRADFEKSEDARELLEQKTRELEETNIRLQKAMERIQSLHGMLPICARCKKIRKDDGYWEQIEHYISTHSDAKFSHSLCPECTRELYPDFCDETEEEN